MVLVTPETRLVTMEVLQRPCCHNFIRTDRRLDRPTLSKIIKISYIKRFNTEQVKHVEFDVAMPVIRTSEVEFSCKVTKELNMVP